VNRFFSDPSVEDGAKRKREERGGKREDTPVPIPFPLGHFTLSQFLLGPSSRGQILPAGACWLR